MSEPETVYIIDDDPSIRASLTWLLDAVDIPSETFESAEAFLEAVDGDGIGVLILDVRMSGMSGIELLEQMTTNASTLQIIILTGHGDVPMAVRAMSTGAFYFIQKPVKGPELVEKVRAAMEKSRISFRQKTLADDLKTRYERLTPREKEVMALIVSGYANKVIAAELGVVERTVEVHRHRVMEKMEAASVADLVLQQQTLHPPPD